MTLLAIILQVSPLTAMWLFCEELRPAQGWSCGVPAPSDPSPVLCGSIALSFCHCQCFWSQLFPVAELPATCSSDMVEFVFLGSCPY